MEMFRTLMVNTNRLPYTISSIVQSRLDFGQNRRGSLDQATAAAPPLKHYMSNDGFTTNEIKDMVCFFFYRERCDIRFRNLQTNEMHML